MKQLKCIICGMNIEDKNVDFNSSGIVNRNDKDQLNTCPFCGAAKEYLNESGQTYFSNIENIDEFTLKVLDHAMKLEVFNGEFYKEASIKSNSEDARKMFEALSRIEFMHARIHQKLGGFEKLPILAKIDYSKYDTDEQLLKAAKAREEHAVAYYSKYIHQISCEKLKVIFKALSQVEQEHIELTSYKK